MKKEIYSLRTLCLILFACFIAQSGMARHIVGGDMTYACIGSNGDNFTIELTIMIYRDAYQDGRTNLSGFDSNLEVGIFRESGNNYRLAVDPIRIPLDGSLIADILPPANPCFRDLGIISTDRAIYKTSINLPIIDDSYLITYQRCCRNNNVSNVRNSGSTGAVLSVEISPMSQANCNSSPTFDVEEDIIICAGYPEVLDFSATDTDRDPVTSQADSLSYKFCQPVASGGQGGSPESPCPVGVDCGTSCTGVTPSPTRCNPEDFLRIVLETPSNAPIPGSPSLTINERTGIISGTPTIEGLYVLAVCVEEWREGVKIGEIRRDFQFTVIDCTVVALPGPEGLRGAEELEKLEADCRAGGIDIDSCGDIEVEFENYTDANPSDVTWMWSIEESPGDTLRITDEWEPKIKFPGIGQYWVQLIVNPNEICADTCEHRIDVTENLEAEFKEIQFDACDDVLFELDGTDSKIPSADFDITWDFGDGTTREGKIATNPGILFQTHSYDEPGEKLVKLILSNRNCSDEASQVFSYFPIPSDFKVEPTQFKGCQPAEITFENLPAVVDDTYEVKWEFGDGNDSDETTPTHIYEDPGKYSVELRIKSPSGCEDIRLLTDFIEILPAPRAEFVLPDIVEDLSTPVSFANLTQGAIRYEWDFGDGSTSDDPNPSHVYDEPGTYPVTLIAFQEDGSCIDTLTQDLLVFPPIKPIFPNAFTPNGDGENDEFLGIDLIDGFGNYELRIFDRWGQKVFEAFNIREAWNGRKFNTGEILPQGVYVYVARFFNVAGDKEVTNGTVLLIN